MLVAVAVEERGFSDVRGLLVTNCKNGPPGFYKTTMTQAKGRARRVNKMFMAFTGSELMARFGDRGTLEAILRLARQLQEFAI